MLTTASRLLATTYSPQELGRLGESRAARHYRLRGYRIVSRNLRLADGEIDLVVRRGALLAFVEVKTRHGTNYGAPHEAVDARKRERLVALAEEYMRSRELSQCDVRFDVVSLIWNGFWFNVTRYRDAFRPVANPDRPWKWVGSGWGRKRR
ncbi:MAG TPA: YraN family protein [Thermoanaerobaculia bacterium]|nr:YraN family protein [Thermoanaerobaculia bacterium]